VTDPAGGSGVAPARPLRIRPATRALVIDQFEQVLLVRFEFEFGTRWALPGGGIDAGETVVEALRRELREEVGLVDPDIGPLLWNRVHHIPILGTDFEGQHEQVHLVRCAHFTPAPMFSWEELNAERMFEIRWWTLAELATSETVLAPSNLAELAAAVVRDGPPETPWDAPV
jgi:ADP-ribose pyrophosphatase YjhB (NUDIX family)